MIGTGEICLLAGGLSRRMGRDKSQLRLNGKTILRHIQKEAVKTTWPCRIISHDAIPRCGPLGGIHAALSTTKGDRVLFLACDMPFLSADWIRKIMRGTLGKPDAVFTRHAPGRVGFPFLLHRCHLAQVQQQLQQNHFSLQQLAAACHAHCLAPPEPMPLLCNINTPADWARAKKLISSRR